MKSPIWILILLIVGAACAFGGYQYSQSLSKAESGPTVTIDEADSVVERIVGQGNLQPANGTVNIMAPPGERIEKLMVAIGGEVDRDTPLVTLASRKVREIELKLAESRKSEAEGTADMLAQANEMKAQSASIAGTEVEEAKDKVENQKSSIAALEKSVQSAKKMLGKLNRMRANPTTRELVGVVEIEKQQALVDRLVAQLQQTNGEIEVAKQAIRRSEKMAGVQLQLAELNETAPKESVPTETLDLAIEAATMARDATTLKSPIKGRVLDLGVHEGSTVVNRPIMVIADTTKMVCIAEIADTQLKNVQEGQSVTMLSAAFDEGEITGTVIEIGKMIAPPSMKDPNPFAAVDRKTGTVKIEIAPEHCKAASRFVNLQVEVRIAKTKGETKNAAKREKQAAETNEEKAQTAAESKPDVEDSEVGDPILQ